MGSTTTFGALAKKAKEDGAFDDVIPDGDFHLKVASSNAPPEKPGKAPRIGVRFVVVSSPDVAEDDPVLGKGAWVNLYFSEKAAPISFRQLKSWGLSQEWLEETETPQQIADALLGVVVDATVGHRNWGTDDENTDNTIKVHEVLVPPAVGGVVDEAPEAKPKRKKAKQVVESDEEEAY